MNHGNAIVKPFWKAAPLKGGGSDIPGGGFEVEQSVGIFHVRLGTLLPWKLRLKLWVEVVIEAVDLVEKFLVEKNRCVGPDVGEK